MPNKPPTYRQLVKQQQWRPAHERSSTKQGYNYRWQKARRAYLAQHPLCAECLAEKKTCAATIVDHIKPHKGDMRLFWDRSNWQALCKPHHDSKTAREQGLGH